MRLLLLGMAGLMLALPATAAADEGKLEVTAKLVEIPSSFPPDDLYDYSYVMKYEVTEGKLKGQSLFVAHYKPTLKRKMIKDQMSKFVEGKLKRFKVGEVHKLTLDPDLQKIWQGAVIDDFFAQDRKSVRYWCLKADPA